MEQECNYLRTMPGKILIHAARLGKAARPPISLIFNETTKLDYTAARIAMDSQGEVAHAD